MPSTPPHAEGELLFREDQRLSSNRILLVALFVVPVVLLGVSYPFFARWLAGRLDGAHPSSPTELLVAVVALATTQALLVTFFFAGRLITEIRSDALYVQFYPLTRRHRIAWREIAHAEIRTYAPLAEFGGYGIRWSGSGKAYNVRGDQGLQIVRNDGERLLIGTQRAAELRRALAGARDAADA